MNSQLIKKTPNTLKNKIEAVEKGLLGISLEIYQNPNQKEADRLLSECKKHLSACKKQLLKS